jgi:putative glutamine amidotransferase
MQVMAVHAGGTLDQHTPDLVGHEHHSPGGDAFGDIRVSTEPGSRVASLLGSEVEVSCHHHQSVRDAPGFTVTARADDGTVEAMEAAGEAFRVGVQWHPEMRTELALVRGLVDAAG